MLEVRKFLFITPRQHIWITSSFIIATISNIYLLYLFATQQTYNFLFQPAFDLLKLILSGFAFWGLVLLYASSNSPERIRRETSHFFAKDVLHAFNDNGYNATNTNKKVILLRNKAGNALFSITDSNIPKFYVWCVLNVYRLEVIFLLPPEFANDYQNVYQATIKGFDQNEVRLETFGIQKHDLDGTLEKPESFHELFTLRRLKENFLFDAAIRTYIANCIIGDVRSLITEIQRQMDH